MNVLKKSLLVMISALLCSCGGNTGSALWENIPVVAKRTGELIELNPSLLKDTLVIPLSHLIEDVHVVKLDNKDEALVAPSLAVISDNHILVKNGNGKPYKLFDIKGNYLADIGAIGQGPGEYNLIYSQQLDEKNQRVYLLPWQTEQILVYDFSGKSLDPIRLPVRVPKGIFKVQGDQVAVGTLPFEGMPNVAWIQTTGGEVLYEIPAGSLTLPRDFSNEIYSSQNTENMDLSFWLYRPRLDTLYHVDFKGRLSPKFTAKFEGEALQPHSYAEWGDYFLGTTSTLVYSTDGTNHWTEGKEPAYYIVDKKTLKGAFVRIENDLFGKKEEWPLYLFNNGFYCVNDEPGNIEELLGNALKSTTLDDKYREKWATLQKQINSEDNNYIIYAKMKK